MNIQYIQVDETHIIEVTPQGEYIPRRLVNQEWKDILEGWGLYKNGNKSKKFRTEKGARTFLETADGERRYLVCGYA